MIQLQNITHSFLDSNGIIKHQVLKNINLLINEAEIFGIIGRSGAGKSTLIRTFNLLTYPDFGDVLIKGISLKSCTKKELIFIRRKIGMIFQDFNLLNSRNIIENIALPLELSGLKKNIIKKNIEPVIELVGLGDYRYRYPYELSGGQKQKVCIARALVSHPDILLSDEATSALDPETTCSILDLLKKLNNELNLTIILITHQMEVVKRICQRVALMEEGRIIETNSILNIFLHPQYEITRRFIGQTSIRAMDEIVKKKILEGICPEKDHLFHLTYISSDLIKIIFSKLEIEYMVTVNVLYGNIENIQGVSISSFIVYMKKSKDNLKEIMAFLKAHEIFIEEVLSSQEFVAL